MASFRGRHFVAKGRPLLYVEGAVFVTLIEPSGEKPPVSEEGAIQEKSGTGREEDAGGGRKGTECRRLLQVTRCYLGEVRPPHFPWWQRGPLLPPCQPLLQDVDKRNPVVIEVPRFRRIILSVEIYRSTLLKIQLIA